MQAHQEGVRAEFLKENLTFTGEDSPLANLMFSVMGVFAGFETALIGERQRQGMPRANAQGGHRGRRKAPSAEMAVELREQNTGLADSASAAKPSTCISRQRAVGRSGFEKGDWDPTPGTEG